MAIRSHTSLHSRPSCTSHTFQHHPICSNGTIPEKQNKPKFISTSNTPLCNHELSKAVRLRASFGRESQNIFDTFQFLLVRLRDCLGFFAYGVFRLSIPSGAIKRLKSERLTDLTPLFQSFLLTLMHLSPRSTLLRCWPRKEVSLFQWHRVKQ